MQIVLCHLAIVLTVKSEVETAERKLLVFDFSLL